MARSAAVGGILLALIEGVGIMITRMTAEQFKPGIVLKYSFENIFSFSMFKKYCIFLCFSYATNATRPKSTASHPKTI